MNNLNTIYQEYHRLSSSQKKSILKRLQGKGYPVESIQAKQYTPDNSVGTHFFFYMTGEEEPKRYWEIPEDMWNEFVGMISLFKKT